MRLEEFKSRRGHNFIDMTGERFGKLLVLSYAGSDARRQSRWKCECDCGKTAVVSRTCLVSGHTRSCGCLHSRVNGEASNGKQTPEYTAWAPMKRRCASKNDKKFHRYGGRGISVCDRWKNDYKAFLADVGRRPSPRHSLDRIDNDGNYEPGNVRWATAKEQVNNRAPVPRLSWREAAKHAYSVVRDFESVIADYTGAKHVVTCESCTSALLLICSYLKVAVVEIPKFTYVGVPQSILHAGGKVQFRDEEWVGQYRLEPYPIYDSARNFTSGMYVPGSFMCLSFHYTKHLSIGRGGAIVFDDDAAVEWLKRARFDGRKEGVHPRNDKGIIRGWHAYMLPEQAARGLMLMSGISEHNDPLPNSDYPDLSLSPVFMT